MNLSDLVGHTVGLHGVDGSFFCVSKDGERKVYEAVEDEGDGYRSSLDELREVPECNRVFSRRPYVTATARDKAGDCDGWSATIRTRPATDITPADVDSAHLDRPP